jgi:RNA polymerase sigma factor (TIGR02999 family)
MDTTPNDVTLLLERVRSGDKAAENRLYEIVMPELRRIARRLLSRERPNHTLQGTELVHRVYIRLAGCELSLRDRGHFFAIYARAMRRELIDYAKSRPKVLIMPIDGVPPWVLSCNSNLDLMLLIDELLDEMRESLLLECSIVELKFYASLTNEETAEVLGMPLRTMEAFWRDARIWLFERAEKQQWKPIKSLDRRVKI